MKGMWPWQIPALLLLALSSQSAIAVAQAGVIARWSVIPPYVEMRAVGDIPTQRIPLQWNCGRDTVALALPIGAPIIRNAVVNGQTIQIPSTVTAADSKRIRGDTAVDASIAAFRGTLFVDEKVPSRLRVNPYLWTSVPEKLRCPALPDSGKARTSAETLRDREFYFDLENRQTVAFTTITVGFAAIAIPLRYRPGYSKGDTQVGTEVADPVTIGALFGATSSRLRYQYVRDAKNTLSESSRWTIGPFAALGKGTVDEKSSLTAATRDTVGHSFPTLSIGVGVMANIRGLDLGLFAAPEFGFGANAKSWDYNRRVWWGLGLSFSGGK